MKDRGCCAAGAEERYDLVVARRADELAGRGCEAADVRVVANELTVHRGPERVDRADSAGGVREPIAGRAHRFLMRERHVSSGPLPSEVSQRVIEHAAGHIDRLIRERNGRGAQGRVLQQW